ncbi:MAG: VWA domain-containing protein [Bryocella sp.]
MSKKVAGWSVVAVTTAALVWQAGFAEAQGNGAEVAQNAPVLVAQQEIPEAPKPQTLPTLNTIRPVGSTIPDAPPPANLGAPAKDDQLAPGTSLPASPTPAAAAQDDGPLPELPAAGEGSKAFRLTTRVNFVEVPFTVKDSKGRLVPALTWRDVRVFENGQRQRLAVFTTDPFPMSVALVIDQSVTYDTMRKINDSLQALQGAFAPYDEVTLFTYNNGVQQRTPPNALSKDGFLGAQTARFGAILSQSKGKGREPYMNMGGPLEQNQIRNNQLVDPNTAATPNQQTVYSTPEKEYHTLNDAILMAAQAVAKAGPGRRRIVYVISDGKEYGSKASEKEVIRFCQTNKVTVYATLVGDSAIPVVGFLDRIHLPYTMRNNALPRYTESTGSGAPDYEFRQGGIEKSFQRITLQARTQYTVGYYSHESIYDNKFRRLEVQVMRPGLSVIAKPGYYPTPEPSRGARPVQRKPVTEPAATATPKP